MQYLKTPPTLYGIIVVAVLSKRLDRPDSRIEKDKQKGRERDEVESL